MKKQNDKIKISLKNLHDALEELKSYVAKPVETNRDRAGIIKAFEFTFELFWKTYQKLAQNEGLEVGGPKSSLKAAFQMGMISPEEEAIWLSMLDDRNLMSHVYQSELSLQIVDHIQSKYLPQFMAAFEKLRTVIK